MALSFGQNEVFSVRESFEVKTQYATGHAHGLVIVLDRRIGIDLSLVTEMDAIVRLPNGDSVRYTIDEAKDHLAASSLFFSGKIKKDVPDGATIVIASR